MIISFPFAWLFDAEYAGASLLNDLRPAVTSLFVKHPIFQKIELCYIAPKFFFASLSLSLLCKHVVH